MRLYVCFFHVDILLTRDHFFGSTKRGLDKCEGERENK